MNCDFESTYGVRKLADGFPDIERLGVEYHSAHHEASTVYTEAYLRCLERLIDLKTGNRRFLVIGCGPRPHAIRELVDRGFDAVGLEPVKGLAESATDFLADPKRVRVGAAESIPFGNGEFRVVWMTSVLEHVDSPDASLEEALRVLTPGGVLFVYTTNRWKVSLTGFNGEYRTKFFNWLPQLVQESYVFKHLHYDPSLANYNPRPAFHWFSYTELCRLGRRAGFGQFYSWLDLADRDNPLIRDYPIRRLLLEKVRYNPWLRALALTQAGGCIFMLKRPV